MTKQTEGDKGRDFNARAGREVERRNQESQRNSGGKK